MNMTGKNQMRNAILCAAAISGFIFAAIPAAALNNTGFETPDKGDGGYEYAPAGASWIFSNIPSAGRGAGLSGPNGPWKCDSISPDPVGNQFAFLQSDSTITQNMSGLVIGGTYELSFFESYRTEKLPGNDLSVILDEGLATAVTIYSNANVTNRTWILRRTSQLVAAKTSYTLTFRSTHPLGTGDRTTIIDGVLLTLVEPTVKTVYPADNSTGMLVGANLVATFDADVLKGTGNITLRQSSDDSIVETFDVATNAVTVNGAQVTINPVSDLARQTGYYVEIDAGAFKDHADRSCPAVSGNSKWNFTTMTDIISFVKITSDADCDIGAYKTYTHKLDFGQGIPGALINGVQFNAYNHATNGFFNFSRAISSGSYDDHAGNGGYNVSGNLANLMTDMYYNGGCAAGGTTTWTLSGLTPGADYITRIYVRQWEAGSRPASMVFDPDGAGPLSDAVSQINEDNATSVGMAAANDAYYISYPFRAVAGQNLLITVTQHTTNGSWHLYGLTNEMVPPAGTLILIQ